MARVLGVGIATLDIINSVAGYPAEDAEVRAMAQRVCRGGNCTNTLVVLSQLGHACAWAGVIAEEPDAARIEADLAAYHIDRTHCRRERGESAGDPGWKMPTSYIVHNTENGSRTIVHYRDLPEYDAESFFRIDLGPYDWLHFEGRNIADTRRMLERARAVRPGLSISLEVEKPRPEIERVFALADVLLVSRHYANARGYTEPLDVLRAVRTEAPDADLICAWGERGAFALDRQGQVHAEPAHVPPRVVDTLGAGDTFHAGVIDAYLRGLPLTAALKAGCVLAGKKCGRIGLDLGLRGA